MMSLTLAPGELVPIVYKKGNLKLLDQRYLPSRILYINATTAADVVHAIKTMVVRGAPAIGICAAYGVVLSFLDRKGDIRAVMTDVALLAASRPTAVNLHHALDKLSQCLQSFNTQSLSSEEKAGLLFEAALAIHQQDLAFNQNIARHGQAVLSKHQFDKLKPVRVLTHCNTGSLATGGLGTALGIIKQGARAGLIGSIFATETRPWLQGSRLTAFELQHESLNVQLLVEGAAASLMASEQVDWLIVGADRIAANGDTANKVGTLTLALLAHFYGVKVMVAAPTTTVDMTLVKGSDIPIEYRSGAEILAAAGYENTSAVPVYNPVFDVTPAQYIDFIVTELGAVRPNDLKNSLSKTC